MNYTRTSFQRMGLPSSAEMVYRNPEIPSMRKAPVTRQPPSRYSGGAEDGEYRLPTLVSGGGNRQPSGRIQGPSVEIDDNENESSQSKFYPGLGRISPSGQVSWMISDEDLKRVSDIVNKQQESAKRAALNKLPPWERQLIKS